MTFWTSELVSSLNSSPTRVVMAIVPIRNEKNNFLLNNMLFNDILKVWHHFVTSFVTNARGYGHSSNLESSKKLLFKNMFSMTFWTSELVSSLNSSPTRVVMAIVPIRNEKTTFYWIICYLMTFWKCDITSSLLSSPTRVVMALVPIWNNQKNIYSKICFFHDILNKWARIVA